MKNKERIQMIINRLSKTVISLVLLISTGAVFSTWAGTRISYGEPNDDGDVIINIFPNGTQPASAGGQPAPGLITPLGVYMISNSTSNMIYCYSGDASSGDQSASELYHNLINSGKQYGGKPLFKTTTQGVYVSVEILNFSSPGITFGIGAEHSLLADGTNKDEFSGHVVDPSQCTGYQQLTFQVRTTYYLGSDYQPAIYTGGGGAGNYDSFKAEIDSNSTLDTRGFASTNSPGFSIRSSTHGQGYYLVVEFRNLGLMITSPTCYADAVAGTNVKGNTVDFGNVLTTDISNGTSNSKRQFQIALKDCVGIGSIITKLSTTKTGNSVRLLGNQQTNNAAGGIGVKITGLNDSVTGKAEQLYPNNPYSVYTEYESATNSDGWIDVNAIDVTHPGVEHILDFEAQLVPDFVQDQPAPVITAGGFEATGTFSMTYP
ncbi:MULTISPECIES: fimbrial protein [unclassified Escherichia]|uniref:fimbrial protein n=1 Tax=unclassified Escherichia TaxID=2608889 RepID=UPI001EF0071C|nr:MULTISPECIES: fimbrial protein [unclassified Escherichia]